MTRTRLGLLLALAVLAVGCTGSSGSESGAPDDSIRIVATTTVLADLVANVGGPRVVVDSLVPKGAVVETFDPRPSAVAALSSADLVVMNGFGLDAWLGRLIETSAKDSPTLVLAEDLEGVEYLGGEDAEPNPHLWLNVQYAMAYVDRIVDALATVDPSGATAYRQRGVAYRAELAELDRWIRERMATVPAENRRIVSFHEAYPYFAAAYGLEIVGTIVDSPGQDPSAGELADLLAAIRTSGVRAIVTEAQFSPTLAKALAEDAGVAVVSDLYNDSLGDPPVDTYVGMLRWNTERTVEALAVAP